MIYVLANGFHDTQAAVRCAPGKLVSGRAMRAAGRKLCGGASCTCESSAASTPRPEQAHGVGGHPEIRLEPVYEHSQAARLAGWDGKDMDAMLCIVQRQADDA